MVLFAARSMCILREVGKMPLRPDSINATQRKAAVVVVVVAKVPEQNGPTPGSPAHGYASPNPPIREPKPIRLLTGEKSSRATLAHSMSKTCPLLSGGAIYRGIREEKGNGAHNDKTKRNSPNATKLRRGIPFLRING